MLRKTMFYTKEFFKTTTGKVVVAFTVVGAATAAFIVPTILSAQPKDLINAYNRDSNSGTYSVWTNFLEFQRDLDPSNPDVKPDKWSHQTREVTGNDKMLSYVNGNTYTMGYVSAESVDYSNVTDLERPNIDKNIKNTAVIDFIDKGGNVQIASADNISNDNYGRYQSGDTNTLVRGFNQFWRGTFELNELWNYWDNGANGDTVNSNAINEFVTYVNNTDATDQEKAAWVFYNWTLFGESAYITLEEASVFSDKNKFNMSDEELEGIVSGLDIEEFNFTTVGSTSVSASVASMINEGENQSTNRFEDIVDVPVDINISGHDGSGDAFKSTGIFDNESMLIGYQSRVANKAEYSISPWDKHDVVRDDGTFGNHYQTFGNDPLILLANKKGTKIDYFDASGMPKEGYITALSREAIDRLYHLGTGDYSWQDLYDSFNKEYGNQGALEHIKFDYTY